MRSKKRTFEIATTCSDRGDYSEVKLKILRKGKEAQRFEIALVRDKIKLEEEAASISYMDREVNGQKLKIGLLNLPSFYAEHRKNGPLA